MKEVFNRMLRGAVVLAVGMLLAAACTLGVAMGIALLLGVLGPVPLVISWVILLVTVIYWAGGNE